MRTIFESVLRDIRIATRMFLRTPVFSITAVLSLGLGIGTATAIFAIADRMLWRSLPVKDAATLEHVQITRPRAGQNTFDTVSYPIYESLRARGSVLQDLAAYGRRSVSVEFGEGAQMIDAAFVSGQFFSSLGVTARLGRPLAAYDDEPGAPIAAAITQSAWRTRFGSDPMILARTLRIEASTVQIVGVTQDRFNGIETDKSPELFLSLSAEPVLLGTMSGLNNINSHWLMLIGRPAPGVSEREARVRLQAEWPGIRDEFASQATSADGRKDLASLGVDLHSAARGLSLARGRYSRPLVVLVVSVLVLLAITVANLASLFIVRALGRRQEISVRVSVGASRGRLLGQLMCEAVVLATAGTIVGQALGLLGLRFVGEVLSRSDAGWTVDTVPDWRMMLTTTLFGFAAAAMCGIVPAFLVSRSRGPERTRGVVGAVPMTRLFVGVQVALAVVLLIAAGLFVRTMGVLLNTDLGFQPRGTLVARVDLVRRGERGEQLVGTQLRLLDRIRSIPGVGAVSLSAVPPLTGGGGISLTFVSADGYTNRADEDTVIYSQTIAPGYFGALAIPIVSGRDFTLHDTRDVPAVAIIDETTSRYYFGDRGALGNRIVTRGGPKLVVGVVKDAKYETIREQHHRTIYIPLLQSQNTPTAVTLLVRATNQAAVTSLAAPVRAAIVSQVGDTPVRTETLEQTVDRTLVEDRLLVIVSSTFGVLALNLVAFGVYGVLAYLVARRTPEIGVRKALGATAVDIAGFVAREAGLIVVSGSVLGLGIALSFVPQLSSLLFGIQPHDPLTIASAVAVVFCAAVAATVVPAWRAGRIEAVEALRRL